MREDVKLTISEVTACSQCGYVFSCGLAADHDGCWCFSYPRHDPLPDQDRSTESGCLCPYCLNTVIVRAEEKVES